MYPTRSFIFNYYFIYRALQSYAAISRKAFYSLKMIVNMLKTHQSPKINDRDWKISYGLIQDIITM